MSSRVFAILLCLPSLSFCVRPYTIKFLSYSHEYLPEYYEVVSLRLYNNSQRLVYNGSVIYAKDINNFNITFQMIASNKRSGLKWKLMDVTLNGCEMLIGLRKRNIVTTIIGNLKKFGNIIAEKCPYKKDFDYNVNDFYLDAENFPSNAPDVRLNIFVGLTEDKIEYFKGNFEVAVESVKPKG